MVEIVDDTAIVDIGVVDINLFGDTNDHPSSQTCENTILGLNAQMAPVNGIGHSIMVLLIKNETFTVKCALYRTSDNTLIGTTEEKSVAYGTSWEEFIFNDPKPQLVANELYYICAWSLPHPEAGFYCSVKYEDNLNSLGSRYKLEAYGAWPDPITLGEWGTERTIGIYCVYTI